VDGRKPIGYPIFLRVKNETYKLSQSIKDELGIILFVERYTPVQYERRQTVVNKGKRIHIHFFNGTKWALYKEELTLLSVS
jgi:hypothetical protein